MFKTFVGASEDASSVAYLRPETAGGMFLNFKNILDSFHPKLPFGMGQIGKAFRNEIAPRDFIFRAREFKQMEIEYFVDPRDEQKVTEIFEAWYENQMNFLSELGLSKSKLHKIEVPESDRAHYSKRSIDTEFDFPFGQKELLGLAYRTDFDLRNHSTYSGVDLSYYDEETKERFIPHCIEPTFGLERLVLAVLSDAYSEDNSGEEVRVYLKFSPKIAPVKIAVFPLLKNKPELVEKAKEIYKQLKKEFGAVVFDDNGNIGKRYRRQDEIGTPWCVTVDFETIEKDAGVTVRDRDTGEQKRMSVSELIDFVKSELTK
jgi:glycyl-tRNA synthetase